MPVVQVALDVPLHRLFDYEADSVSPADIGRRVRVPFGRGERVGIVVGVGETTDWPATQRRAIGGFMDDLLPLPGDFIDFCRFVSTYYQAPLGEVILQSLPPALRRPDSPTRRLPRSRPTVPGGPPPALTAEQAAALEGISVGGGFQATLLHGVTGSGKTEVYLRLTEQAVQQGGQVLLLVPEINLTPQLESRVRGRFPQRTVVALHSDLSAAARERHWRTAFSGEADIILGTRLAVFTPLPRLTLIIVDEEHDASFKQQDGIRYSARDLAVARARQRAIPVVLGSATPSLESWANADSGRYRRIVLRQRASTGAQLPVVSVVDTRKAVLQEGVGARLQAAIATRLARGEQSLLFLNRRGYAPVLACPACGWVSRCHRCAANLVVHLADQRMRCHHCGFEARLPRACPTCGNQDIHPFGRGTQRLEQWLTAHFPAARVLRVDRDAVKSRRQWEAALAQIHGGEADILVGTQMLAKGHDFPRLTLVGVLGADAALFAADWRAPERLFAQLMQVAGRAGRAKLAGEVLIQTQYPDHPLFAALAAHDYEGFARCQLAERAQAGFPPYAFQAMLRAEAPEMAAALQFLKAAAAVLPDSYPTVALYDPVPMRLARLANLERAQVLIESPSRPALQALLPEWRQSIEAIRTPSRLRWHLEVDPLEC